MAAPTGGAGAAGREGEVPGAAVRAESSPSHEVAVGPAGDATPAFARATSRRPRGSQVSPGISTWMPCASRRTRRRCRSTMPAWRRSHARARRLAPPVCRVSAIARREDRTVVGGRLSCWRIPRIPHSGSRNATLDYTIARSVEASERILNIPSNNCRRVLFTGPGRPRSSNTLQLSTSR